MGVIKDIIERRVNTTGVSEPVVVVQGCDRVVIELPGISDVDSVRRLVGQTGQLDFVPLGQTQMTEGQVLDLEQFPPLFSGDQLESAAVGQDQTTGGLTVTFVLKNNGPESGAQLFADLHRASTSASTSRSSSTARSSPPRRSTRRSRTARSRSGPAASAASRPRRPTRSSRSSSSARCRSRSRSCRASRSRRRSASSSSTRACWPAPSASRS